MAKREAAVSQPPAKTEKAAPKTASKTDAKAAGKPKNRRQPRYNVILWNDDDHSYDYVIRMMRELFGHPKEKGMQIAVEVDKQGKAICLTTTREHAELKQEQIHAFGKDKMINQCQGSMSCTIEPEA